MRLHLKKLNTKGFAHHLIIPVVAITAVAGIGAYVLTRSKAATVTTVTNGPVTLQEYDQVNHLSKIYKLDPASGTKSLMQQSTTSFPVDQLTWSQNGDKFAYTNQQSIYVSGAADTTAKNVLTTPGTMPCPNGRSDDYSSPAFSPDGTQLAFITTYYQASDCSKSFEKISKMNIDGSNKVDVDMSGFSSYFETATLRWSSDNKFYFIGTDGFYSIPTSGGAPTKVTAFDIGSNYPYPSLRFAISYDGSQIVTERPSTTVNYTTDIYIANIDGSNQRVITQISSDTSSNSNWGLAWAPDGKSIVFTGKTASTQALGIYTATIPADSSTPSSVKRVADAAAFGHTPLAWQPIVSTTTTTSITSLNSTSNWVFSGGASAKSDQRLAVINLPFYNSSATAGTKKMPKLASFANANFGKQAQLCVTARTTTSNSSPIVISFNQFAQGTSNTRSIGFTTSYTRRCTPFTVITKQTYDQAMLTSTDPGFKLRSITSNTQYNIQKVDLVVY